MLLKLNSTSLVAVFINLTKTCSEIFVGYHEAPLSLKDVVANVNHRPTLLQPMGARGEDDELTTRR